MRILVTEADYEAALARAETLMDAAPDTPEEVELDALADMIVAYEDKLLMEHKADAAKDATIAALAEALRAMNEPTAWTIIHDDENGDEYAFCCYCEQSNYTPDPIDHTEDCAELKGCPTLKMDAALALMDAAT